MMNHRLTLWFPLTAALSLTACDALSDNNYRGTPLFAIEGHISSLSTATPTDININLVWGDGFPDLGEQLDILPVFPARFQLSVFNPPHVDELDGSPNQLRTRAAHIVAALPGTEFSHYISFPTQRRDPGILGVDPRHMLYYFPDPIEEGSQGAAVLHGAATAGFHMYDIKCIGPAKAAEIRACLDAYAANGGDPNDVRAVYATCGHYNPDKFWLQPSRDDLQTELTVELIDDLPNYHMDPSECL